MPDGTSTLRQVFHQLILVGQKDATVIAMTTGCSLHPPTLSDTLYILITLRMSTPPQNRQLNTLISNSEQQVDDFVGELTS